MIIMKSIIYYLGNRFVVNVTNSDIESDDQESR